MKRLVSSSLLLVLLFAGTSRMAASHCEVPCGVFDDPMRFEKMLEDVATIRKAIKGIQDMAGKNDAKSVNQTTRWVVTKGEHAVKTQHTIAQYFMAQRIKPAKDEAGQAKYLANLTAAHAVMIAAMKCKQDADPATADTLEAAIKTFYKAYFGKAYGEK
ncbi:MAG: superoxide dismutase [Ni] [Planctomycetota bacterium]|nr:superoxide dismutase [Ni] [Planctomycetota bacterium]